MKLSYISLALAGMAFCGQVQAGPDMRPGLWEITMQLEMPGMPMAMPPVKQTMCFTQQDVESGAKTVPQDSPDNPTHCKPENFNMRGNTATWTLKCDNMAGTGSMTYSGDSYSGSSDISMTMEGETQQMKQTFSGRRLGDCQK
ncbi:MAG: hypothetical protein H6R26_1374 [Proteobacteria bacterium]|nr:hypothetical protein [Pseudomonadota bacterium]